jgi:acetoin utilization protein AcuB
MKLKLVKNWMSRNTITIRPETNLAEAYQLMSDYQIRRLPVVAEGELVGIITQGDMRSATPADAHLLDLSELNFRLAQLTVEEVMTADPVTISADDPIDEAAWVMMEGKISGLPVVDEAGQVVGIITESDIFRLVVCEWGQGQERYAAWVKSGKVAVYA